MSSLGYMLIIYETRIKVFKKLKVIMGKRFNNTKDEVLDSYLWLLRATKLLRKLI